MSETQRINATNIWNVLKATARTFGAQTAYQGDGGAGRTVTFEETLEIVQRQAAGLQTGPLADRTQIGLMAENRPEWPLAYLSIVSAGKTAVPLDANLKPNELTRLIELAGLTCVIASARFQDLLTEIPAVTAYSMEEDAPNSWLSLVGDPNDFEDRAEAADVAVLIYTSGTTGTPKAVQLTHRNLIANLESVKQSLNFGPADTWCSVLPLHHTFEATCGFLTPLACGSTVVYARSLKSRDLIEDLGNNHCTVMCGVPLLFEKIYQTIQRGIDKAPLGRRCVIALLLKLSRLGWLLEQNWGKVLFSGLRRKIGMHHVRMFVSGGAPLPPHIAEFFNLIGFDFMQGYGLTECSPVVSVNRPGNIRFGSVGPPLVDVEIRIADSDGSGVGEVLVKGDNNTIGYLDNPEATAELYSDDGWLRTGDLGCLKDGHLWITGRAKNLIVSAAGKNIYPEELEEKLVASRWVLEALVIGVRKNGKQGEDIRAILVPDLEQFAQELGVDSNQPDRAIIELKLDEEIKQFNRQVADFKRISGFRVVFEELEKTSTKKIKRFVYRDWS